MIENEILVGNKFIMRVNFNLADKSKGDKVVNGQYNKKSQIWLTTTINKERARVYTGLRIEPCYWIRKSRSERGERAMEDGNFSDVQKKENKRINKELTRILGFCRHYAQLVSESNLIQEALPFNKETFEKYMRGKISGKEAKFRKNAEDFIKDYIVRKESMVNNKTRRKLSSGTIYNHNNALRRLRQYCEENHKCIVWELFDRRFEESFTAWMNDKGYSANTISTQYSTMKVWLSDAEAEGYINDRSFHKYPTTTCEVDNIYLTENEIKRIYNIDFSDKEVKRQIDPKSKIEQTRDLFIVACWTGLRFGDWQDLSRASITEDRINLTTHKTLKEVTIPIHPMVKEIIKKYNGKLPKSLDKSKTIVHIQKCGELAKIDTPTVMHRIRGGKEIIITEPKYKLITNHTARRSFCTNMYLRGISPKAIMDISGHKTEENFSKYIKITQQQSAKQLESSFKETEIYTAKDENLSQKELENSLGNLWTKGGKAM